MQGTGVPPVGGSPASPTHPSPHRTRSTTCSAASTQASGSPTPSPARPRRGRRRVLGTPCWKPPPSQATRRMSARDLSWLPQAPVRPFSENKNRYHLPRSRLPPLLLLPNLAWRGPPMPLPPPPSPPALIQVFALSQRGFTACSPPSALSQRPGDPGRGRGCQVGPWGGGGSPAKGPAPVTVGSVFTVRPRQVFYIVNSNYLPIKDFRCSVGRHEGCGHSSSLGGGKGPVSVGSWACDTPAFALQQMGCVPHPHSRLFHHLEPFLRSPLDQSSHPTPMKSLAPPIPLSPSRHPFGSITLHCVLPSTGPALPPRLILSLSTALHSPPWSRTRHL